MGPKTLILHQAVLFSGESDSSEVHPRFQELIECARHRRIPLYVIGDEGTLCTRLSHIVSGEYIVPDSQGEIYGWIMQIARQEGLNPKKVFYVDIDAVRLKAAHNANGAVTVRILSDIHSLEDAVAAVCTGSITRKHAYKTFDCFVEFFIKPPQRV